MCFAPQRREDFRHLDVQKWSEHVVLLTFSLGNVLRAKTACTFSTSHLPKVVRTCCVFWPFWLRNVLRATTVCTFSPSERQKVVRNQHFFTLLTSHRNGVRFFDISSSKSGLNMLCFFLTILTKKCASRHNGLHFFDIATSKNGPNMLCFVRFDLEISFAPQRPALFRHLNFQKWSEPGVLCTFWLGNVLRTITACNVSSLFWPAGSAPAALARLLFDPPEPQIIGKTLWIATFLPFCAPASSFFSLFLFPDLLTSFLLLSDSSHLCFSICPYCRKFDF